MPLINELFELLKDNENLANAIAACASAAAAFLAVLLSVVSIVVSVITLKHQRRHNVLSVRPFPEITVADYEDSLRVKIRNNGAGPMVVSRLHVADGAKAFDSLIECMPDLVARDWTHFSHSLENRTLLPGAEIRLLELTEVEGEVGFGIHRDRVREALAPLSVVVGYTDIYSTKFKSYTKSLSWFGRHSAEPT